MLTRCAVSISVLPSFLWWWWCSERRLFLRHCSTLELALRRDGHRRRSFYLRLSSCAVLDWASLASWWWSYRIALRAGKQASKQARKQASHEFTLRVIYSSFIEPCHCGETSSFISISWGMVDG